MTELIGKTVKFSRSYANITAGKHYRVTSYSGVYPYFVDDGGDMRWTQVTSKDALRSYDGEVGPEDVLYNKETLKTALKAYIRKVCAEADPETGMLPDIYTPRELLRELGEETHLNFSVSCEFKGVAADA